MVLVRRVQHVITEIAVRINRIVKERIAGLMGVEEIAGHANMVHALRLETVSVPRNATVDVKDLTGVEAFVSVQLVLNASTINV